MNGEKMEEVGLWLENGEGLKEEREITVDLLMKSVEQSQGLHEDKMSLFELEARRFVSHEHVVECIRYPRAYFVNDDNTSAICLTDRLFVPSCYHNTKTFAVNDLKDVYVDANFRTYNDNSRKDLKIPCISVWGKMKTFEVTNLIFVKKDPKKNEIMYAFPIGKGIYGHLDHNTQPVSLHDMLKKEQYWLCNEREHGEFDDLYHSFQESRRTRAIQGILNDFLRHQNLRRQKVFVTNFGDAQASYLPDYTLFWNSRSSFAASLGIFNYMELEYVLRLYEKGLLKTICKNPEELHGLKELLEFSVKLKPTNAT